MDTMLSRFAPHIVAAAPGQITADPSLNGNLEIGRDGAFTVCYAPFEYVNTAARVVLVGITPGRQQASNALIEARRQLIAGAQPEAAAKAAKETASFSGPMRASLVEMLNHVGLAGKLGLGCCSQLFGRDAGQVHFTSALRYPVYVNGTNYSGSPTMTRHPLLRRQILEHLAAEARLLPRAVWIPLGPAPTAALEMLAADGVLAQANILDGLPHPSGANGERIAFFLGRKSADKLSAKTNARRLEHARAGIIAKVSNWAA